MPNTPPASIASPFQGVAAEGEENLRQRAAIQDRLDKQTVGVYDERDNSILQAPIADADHLRSLGLVVGDAEAAAKQVRNSPLAKVDAFAHHAANAATFGTYDNIAALLGKKDYLQNEAAVTEENPYTALAGDFAGSALSLKGRGFDPTGVALSAYEGGSAAATNAYTLDEPITAARVLKGSSMAVMYNALFNLAPGVLAKGIRGGGKGLHALNNKFGVFIREGAQAEEALGKATYRPGRPIQPSAKVEEATVKTAAEKMGETLSRDPEVVTREFNENLKEQNKALIELDGLDHESSAADKIRRTLAKLEEKGKALDAEMRPAYGDEGFEPSGQPHPYDPVIDAASNDEGALKKLHEQINRHQLDAKRAHNEHIKSKPEGFDFSGDPESQKILRDYHDYTRLRGKTRTALERLKRGGSFTDAEYEPSGPTQSSPMPNPEARTGEGAFEYPGATKDSQRINMWRKSFEELLGTEENHLADAHRQEYGRLGNAAKLEGRLDDASRHFDNKKVIERELSRRLPDTFHPETGELQPGFAKHIKEYSRLSGNDTSELGSLRYRAASAAEKAAIDAEVSTHPDSAAQYVGDTPSQKAHIGDGEPHVPADIESAVKESKQRLEDLKSERIRGGDNLSEREVDRLNREWDLAQADHDFDVKALERAKARSKPFASQVGDMPPAPGEVNKVSDITGKTPSEQSGASVGKGGPRYLPRYRRGTFWKLNLATLGMMKTVLGAAAAANEIGPFLLNNSERFANNMQALADKSAQGTAGAIRKAVSGTVGRRAALGDTNPKEEYDRNVKTILAGQATPGSLEQGVRTLLGPEADGHPEFTGHVVASLGRQLNVAGNHMPRNVQQPTVRGSNYTPPRSVMIRFNRTVRAINDPDYAIAHPDPDTWAAVKEAHPETAQYVEEMLMGVVSNPKIKLNKQQARNVSILLGQAVTPQNQPDYLKSQHDLVTLSQAPSPPDSKGSGPSSGPKSAKTGQQMLSLEATPEQQNMLNL